MGSKFKFNVAAVSGRQLIEGFQNESYDEVYLVYSEFVSMARQVPVLKQILPIPLLEVVEDEIKGDENVDNKCAKPILTVLFNHYLNFSIIQSQFAIKNDKKFSPHYNI